MRESIVMVLRDDVEVIDLAGPFGAFTIANEPDVRQATVSA